jgi:PAS domain S-box-containing protein
MSNRNDVGEDRPAILVVEDSPTQAEKLKHLLEEHGYRVSVAENGKEALTALEDKLPALVVSDIIMPEMDGYQLCKRIKMDSRKKHIPVILLTSLTKSEDVLEGLECGADYFITKPYSEKYLLDSIGQILLDRKLHYKDRMRIGTEIMVNGKTRLITTDQQQTLSLLISTYEAAVRTNTELMQAQDELRSLNARLEDMVEGRTAELFESNRQLRQEITERARAEKDRVRLATAIEQATESVAILGTDGTLLFVNPAFEKMSGFSAAEAVGMTVFELYRQAPHIEAELREIHRHLSTGQPWSGRSTTKTKDGRTLEVLRTISPVRDERGDVANYVALSTDLTATISLERQLVQAQKMEALGTLAGGIAHDFNNILSAIIGYSELLAEKATLPADQREWLEVIRSAGDTAKDLVAQILSFSRQSASDPKPIIVAPPMKEALKLLRASLPTTVEIRQDIQARTGKILGDATQIHQVVMNLCTNASHAMRDTGGVLSVSLDQVSLGPEETASLLDIKPGPHLRITVSDTGHGMTPEVMERVFEPFFTTKGPREGTGMGLSVVHGIVKNHGGEITVESRPGQGATFRVYLPLIEAADAAPQGAPAPVPTGVEKILLVDDEETITTVVSLMLGRLGYDVVTCNAPIEALREFRAQPQAFNLVITDHIMPKMNGAQLAAELLSIRQDLPVVLYTGSRESITPEKAQSLGVRKLLYKPLSMRILGENVREVLGQKSA